MLCLVAYSQTDKSRLVDQPECGTHLISGYWSDDQDHARVMTSALVKSANNVAKR